MKIKEHMEDFIRHNYLTMSQKELANKLGEGVTASDIQHWLKKNNLYKRKNLFTEDDINYMINNYKNMEYKEIANYLGFTERQIRGKLNNMGYTKLRDFNKNYFNEINSDLKAYFLGYIYADGWVIYNESTRNYEFGMGLQSQDKYILEALNKEIGGVHKLTHIKPRDKIIEGNITHSGEQDCLRIYSKEIVLDLISHGVTPNKTYNYEIPSFPDEYFFDFLRGYIDGDGCYHTNKNNYTIMSLVCMNKEVLQWIQAKLLNYNIHTNIYIKEYV